MSLAERLRSGEKLYTAWSGIPDVTTTEVLAASAFDVITLDMQHGGHHEDSVLKATGAILAAGKPAVVRIPVGRFDMASRALDFGADAVIAPMVNSIDDAQRFAAAMKYPPVGERSWGPTFGMPRRGASDSGRWLAEANGNTLAFAMIETRAALDIAGEIAATPGIDGLFVGPSDFSIAWTGGETVNPSLEDMMEAIASIAAKARDAGKLAAIYVVDPKLVRRYAEMGFCMFALGNENKYISLGVDALLNQANGG